MLKVVELGRLSRVSINVRRSGWARNNAPISSMARRSWALAMIGSRVSTNRRLRLRAFDLSTPTLSLDPLLLFGCPDLVSDPIRNKGFNSHFLRVCLASCLYGEAVLGTECTRL